MSATTLTPEQREQHFHQALQAQQALAELPALRERALQALARQEELLRAAYNRSWHAALSGENPEAVPQQQSLLPAAPAEPAPAPAPPAPPAEKHPEPEPPSGGGKSRRKATESGEKRAERAASARTVKAPEAPAAPAAKDADAVPPPAVPCCTCGDSLADHTGPGGAVGGCHAVKCLAARRCKAFQLGQVYDWTLRWGGGRGETGETRDEPVFWLMPPGLPSRSLNFAHGPLFVYQGSLYHSDPELPGQVHDVLAQARETGFWCETPGERGVPRRVLEAVAAVLLSEPSTPARPEAPATQLELTPAADVAFDSINLEEVEDLRAVRRLLKRKGDTPEGQRVLRVAKVLTTAAREETWTLLLADPLWRVLLLPRAEEQRGDVWLAFGTRALCTLGPWHWDGQALTRESDWAGPHTWPLKGMGGEVALAELEGALHKTLVAQAKQEAAQPPEGTEDVWRVELPERMPHRSIVPLWLVNAARGERWPACWWGPTSGLKPSHHLSGTLRGEALVQHNAVKEWWKAHSELVAVLENNCREGRVPGLKVNSPSAPLSPGPHYYALSGGWQLEVWEEEADSRETPEAFFYDGLKKPQGPFRLDKGLLVASSPASVAWVQEHQAQVVEAEDFCRRGFVHELSERVA